VTGESQLEASLGEVLRFARDGVAFFRRAGEIAADPRVRLAFEKLAHWRQTTLTDLEKAIADTDHKVAAAEAAGPYPFDAVARVECYVCGYTSQEIPVTCPKCGAARYTFTREFTRSHPWEIAVSSGMPGVAALEAAVKGAKGPARSVLNTLLEREKTWLREAERELASAKA